MWDNFIGQQIRRCNRNLLFVNLVLLAAMVVYAGFNRRYLANFLMGTTNISSDQLAALHDPGQRFRYFVHVHGDKSVPTGIQSVEQTLDESSQQVESEETTADYVAVEVGQKLLLVKAPLHSTGADFSGALEPIPSDVYDQTIAPVLKQDPTLQSAFIPAMLDASDYRTEGYWTLGIGIPLLLLVGWNLKKWNERRADYSATAIYKRIAAFGMPETVAQEIDTSLKMIPLEKIGQAHVSGPWLFMPWMFSMVVFHVPDIVWTYPKITKQRVYFIPVGKSYATVIRDRFRYSYEVNGKKKNAGVLLNYISQQVPWAPAGFTQELESLWLKHPEDVIAAVEERKANYGKQGGTATT